MERDILLLKIKQRIYARQAIALLEAVSECFTNENEMRGYDEWQDKLDEFKDWIFDESPIA